MTTPPNPCLPPPTPDIPPSAADVPCTVVDRRCLHTGVRIDNAFYDRYGAHGLAVYTVHLRLTHQAAAGTPDAARIAKLIGLSPQRVRRELKKLKRLGLLAGEAHQAHEDTVESEGR